MATETTTVTCTEKREGSYIPVNSNNVYTRTFTFPVTASATGYDGGSSDILNLITIPAGTKIIDASYSSSVIQTATMTLKLTSKTAFTGAFPAAAAANTWYSPTIAVADIGASGYSTADADEVLQATLGTAQCNAGTYTITLLCHSLGTFPAATTNTI